MRKKWRDRWTRVACFSSRHLNLQQLDFILYILSESPSAVLTIGLCRCFVSGFLQYIDVSFISTFFDNGAMTPLASPSYFASRTISHQRALHSGVPRSLLLPPKGTRSTSFQMHSLRAGAAGLGAAGAEVGLYSHRFYSSFCE